ncbi:DUF1692-domain-containing protein [Mycena olivaceomarginata]|nr:DUF1692-domain-containing protein [Mycena olivaceomarginata]
MSFDGSETSLLEKLDAAVPSAYKQRSDSRGFLTIFVGFVTFLLMLNDIGEFVFGWPDHEFSVDTKESSFMNINVDLVVAMPCSFISVDLRDAVGDRLFLSNTRGRRPGHPPRRHQAHSQALSARQAVAQSRNSRGFFSTMFQWANPEPYMPRYKHEPDARGLMNLSHVITEFSFGPYFPDITQPLDNSLEITHDPFVAYQYFLHVVPTTYIAPRSAPLHTNQYSVTHYTRVLDHHSGTPGIFFKFDLDPMSLTIHQRTIGIVQLIIRMVGVIGGVFVCMGYALKVTTAAVSAFVDNSDDEIPPAVASASALKTKFSDGGNGWVMESAPGSPVPYSGAGSPYSGTPVSGSPYSPAGGYPGSPAAGGYGSQPGTPGFGPPPMSGRSTSGLGPPRTPGVGSPRPQSIGSVPMPGTPQYGIFPPTPSPGQGFNIPPPPSGRG